MSHRWLALSVLFLTFGPPARTAPSLPVVDVTPGVPAGVTIDGSVVDEQLRPVAAATVVLERNGAPVATARADASGHFSFAGVAPGRYTVRVSAKDHAASTRALTIAPGAVSLKLPLVLASLRPANRPPAQTDKMNTALTSPPQMPLPSPPPAASAISAGGRGGGSAGVGRGAGVVAAQPMLQERDEWTFVDSGESYAHVNSNRFESTDETRLSTFGADVDTASYTNVRRFLSAGRRVPRDAVRIEELVNYFRFEYPEPRDGRPIAITTEIGDCPWAPEHKLVLIGARAAMPAHQDIAGRNIVLLIDVSGSMAPVERLPMLKTAFAMFADSLDGGDTLSIVTYAGQSGVALPPTTGSRRGVIRDAIASLGAGGSTNGASGLITAYRMARQSFIPGGVNRVILATDGDFNVGVTSLDELRRLITRERDSGVFLSVLGVGTGNLKDQTMEMLADTGNGNYAYLDSLQEARRVLIREGDATLTAVAKDVKFQVEFDPDQISSWKQLGYEKRQLAARDFDNDRKDAGDMGAGHTVTVLYEVIPARGADRRQADWFTVSARYKLPEGETSALLTHRARPSSRNEFLPFASAVAEFGLLLRDAPGDTERWSALERRVAALRAPGSDADDRSGFRELVAIAAAIR